MQWGKNAGKVVTGTNSSWVINSAVKLVCYPCPSDRIQGIKNAFLLSLWSHSIVGFSDSKNNFERIFLLRNNSEKLMEINFLTLIKPSRTYLLQEMKLKNILTFFIF